MRILLVEDSPDLRQLYARLLRRHGCVVRDFGDGQAALDAALDFSPELVLTDVMMPAMDGIELIRRLRAMPGLSSIPIVAMTASPMAEYEQRARRAGAADFIAKPADLARIVRSYRRGGSGAPGGA